MALTWYIAKIRNYKKVAIVSKEVCDAMDVPGVYRHFTDDSMLHPMTNTFIWQTMSIWWGTWGKDDGPLIYARLKLIEQTSPAFADGMACDIVETGKHYYTDCPGPGVSCPSCTTDKDQVAYTLVHRPLEPRDVKAHLGLQCNVSNDKDTQAWLQHVMGTVRIRELEADYREACPAPKPRKKKEVAS